MVNSLALSRIVLFGVVAAAFPIASVFVYTFGYDRARTADVLSVVYGFGIAAAISTSWWPFECLKNWSHAKRLESMVLVYLGMSYFTHLTWELGWLVAHDAIIANPNAAWTYSWWAYIDGGDARYAHPNGTLLAMEALSVMNGIIGAGALVAFLRSHRTSRGAVLVLTCSAVVHLYSSLLYYLSEAIDGFPNVKVNNFVAFWIKFIIANLPWAIVPWFTFMWAKARLVDSTGVKGKHT